MGLGAWFGKLFGAGEPAAVEAVEYKGYFIRPNPLAQGNQYRVAGTIGKDFPEGRREQRFVRADSFSSREDANAQSILKAQRIIDEQGDGLFGAP